MASFVFGGVGVMTESDKVFAGSIPELNDTYLVPLIFEAYANDLAERAAAFEPKTDLETAAVKVTEKACHDWLATIREHGGNPIMINRC